MGAGARVGTAIGSFLLAVGILITGGGSAAWAAQTTTWGIVAAPSGHSYRSGISHAANGGTVKDAVVVFNRTDQPITINLQVLDTTLVGNAYQFGPPTAGLAARVSVPVGSVTLAGHQQAQIPVTIREPRGVHQTELAGIAAEANAVRDGNLSIQQRLVVLIKATPTTSLLSLSKPSTWLWGILAAAVLVMVPVALVRQRHRIQVV